MEQNVAVVETEGGLIHSLEDSAEVAEPALLSSFSSDAETVDPLQDVLAEHRLNRMIKSTRAMRSPEAWFFRDFVEA